MRYLPEGKFTPLLLRSVGYFDEPELFDSTTEARLGYLVVGGLRDIFSSYGFCGCSALIFRSRSKRIFGLYHALPLDPPPVYRLEQNNGQLERLKGGQAILIEGSASTPKEGLMSLLNRRYGIEHIGTISIPTVADNRPRFKIIEASFDITFRPRQNEIQVVVPSLNQVQLFRGFV